MSVLINFKICDNAKECGGIEVCPTGALSWDSKNETIKIDNEKCISCGACERNCPIGAIIVAHNEEEYAQKQKEIEEDPRTTKDLFVDRYGATPLSEFFMISEDELDNKIGNGITLVECYEDASIQCLLKSIPIKEITANMPKDTLFFKTIIGEKIKEKYKVTESPSLLIFKNKTYLGMISGYYTIEQKEEFMEKINKILMIEDKVNEMELVYKKIEEKDKEQLFDLINKVLSGLPDQSHFIPYEKWELDSMFDDVNYAPLYGAYDGNKLVGMAQLYVSQDMLADFKKEFGLKEYKVCELGGNLVLPEYRGLGITTKLQRIELELAKSLGFDYIISMAHPDNVASCKTLEKVGLDFVKETTLSNGFLRKLYMKKL